MENPPQERLTTDLLTAMTHHIKVGHGASVLSLAGSVSIAIILWLNSLYLEPERNVMATTKKSRSEIAKKAWKTRRENEQKRKRSEAAKKAWETRRENDNFCTMKPGH